MTNLARNLVASATRAGDGPAVRLGDTVLSFAQLDQASARVAGLLRDHGVQPGDTGLAA